jgi:hypothetical protein
MRRLSLNRWEPAKKSGQNVPKNRCRTTIAERMAETRAELPFIGDQVVCLSREPGWGRCGSSIDRHSMPLRAGVVPLGVLRNGPAVCKQKRTTAVGGKATSVADADAPKPAVQAGMGPTSSPSGWQTEPRRSGGLARRDRRRTQWASYIRHPQKMRMIPLKSDGRSTYLPSRLCTGRPWSLGTVVKP